MALTMERPAPERWLLSDQGAAMTEEAMPASRELDDDERVTEQVADVYRRLTEYGFGPGPQAPAHGSYVKSFADGFGTLVREVWWAGYHAGYDDGKRDTEHDMAGAYLDLRRCIRAISEADFPRLRFLLWLDQKHRVPTLEDDEG